jgi:hypothetical protein
MGGSNNESNRSRNDGPTRTNKSQLGWRISPDANNTNLVPTSQRQSAGRSLLPTTGNVHAKPEDMAIKMNDRRVGFFYNFDGVAAS